MAPCVASLICLGLLLAAYTAESLATTADCQDKCVEYESTPVSMLDEPVPSDLELLPERKGSDKGHKKKGGDAKHSPPKAPKASPPKSSPPPHRSPPPRHSPPQQLVEVQPHL